MYENEYGKNDILSENTEEVENEIYDTPETAPVSGDSPMPSGFSMPGSLDMASSGSRIDTPQNNSYVDSYSNPTPRRPYTDYVGYQNMNSGYAPVGGGTTPPTGGGTNPPAGGYYSGATPPAGPDNGKKKKEKKKGKAGLVVAIVAVLLAGLLIGGGLTYYFLSGTVVISSDDAQAIPFYDEEAEDDTDDVVDTQDNKNDKDTDKNDQGKTSKDDTKDTSDTLDVTIGTTTDDTVPVIENEEGALSVAQIAEKCLPSVVAITNYGVTEVRSMWGNFTQESESAGSGIIIGQTDSELLILTNYHVVADNQKLSVVFSWEEDNDDADNAEIINAVVKDYDSVRDIAVIAINMSDLSDETISNIALATIGNSDDLVLGEQVVAIGNALGYGQSVTTGIVSAINREVEMTPVNGSGTVKNDFIQTDAAINPGNSGGALFNMKGELVGVNSAKIGGDTVEGMGYAIPISEIIVDVEDMMEQETRVAVAEEDRGYLGVSIVDVTSDISETYNIPQGAYVSSVTPGAAADNAGIQKEDIITEVNGKQINSSSELKDYLSYYAAGDTVTLTVARKSDGGYEDIEIDVTLSAADDIQSGDASSDAPAPGGSGDGQTGSFGSSDFDGSFGFSFPFGFGG